MSETIVKYEAAVLGPKLCVDCIHYGGDGPFPPCRKFMSRPSLVDGISRPLYTCASLRGEELHIPEPQCCGEVARHFEAKVSGVPIRLPITMTRKGCLKAAGFPQPLQLEVGKAYKDGMGKRVVINEGPDHNGHFWSNESGCYAADGKWPNALKPSDSIYHLIAPWTEADDADPNIPSVDLQPNAPGSPAPLPPAEDVPF